jgi:hypothetical protein
LQKHYRCIDLCSTGFGGTGGSVVWTSGGHQVLRGSALSRCFLAKFDARGLSRLAELNTLSTNHLAERFGRGTRTRTSVGGLSSRSRCRSPGAKSLVVCPTRSLTLTTSSGRRQCTRPRTSDERRAERLVRGGGVLQRHLGCGKRLRGARGRCRPQLRGPQTGWVPPESKLRGA